MAASTNNYQQHQAFENVVMDPEKMRGSEENYFDGGVHHDPAGTNLKSPPPPTQNLFGGGGRINCQAQFVYLFIYFFLCSCIYIFMFLCIYLLIHLFICVSAMEADKFQMRNRTFT